MEKFLIHRWDSILSSSFGFIQIYETTPIRNLATRKNSYENECVRYAYFALFFLSYYVRPQQVNFLFLILGSDFKSTWAGRQITNTGNNYTVQIIAAKHPQVHERHQEDSPMDDVALFRGAHVHKGSGLCSITAH